MQDVLNNVVVVINPYLHVYINLQGTLNITE